MAKDIEELVAGLQDFRSRSESIRELIAIGDAAVQPLVQALHGQKQEGAQWAILRCLGEMHARDAIAHIVPLLEDRRCRTAAHETLIRIVGEDLGPGGEAWLNWLQSAGGAEKRRGASVLLKHMSGYTDDRLMALALRDSGGPYEEAGTGKYVVHAPVDGGTQTVTVRMGGKDHEGSPIVVVYADCGPADPKEYEYALKRNFRMPYGALAVRDTNKGPYFVMFNAVLREALSPIELRKSIFTVAERAAQVRRDLEESRRPDPGES